MRRNLFFLVVIFFNLFWITSCVPDENCKNCQAIVYDVNTNAEISRSDAVEYCGDQLSSKENAKPVTIGNEKTIWVCK
jgi:hypothetical protein